MVSSFTKAVAFMHALAAVQGERIGVGRTHSKKFHQHSVNGVNNAHFQAAGGENASASVTHFYTKAILDHYGKDVASSSTNWNQRFYVDEQFWCGEGCPVFVYIGGEGPQGPITDRLMISHLAQQHGALLLALEHRYYGESLPVPDMSTENMQYLTSEQALADLARFRNYIALNTNATSFKGDADSEPPLKLKASAAQSKFVVFGGSYPGNLAAWFKIKYPSLAVGSVASSAPVYAEYNFEQYAQVTGFGMGYAKVGGSAECYSAIKKGVTLLTDLLKITTPYGTSTKIPEALRPCSVINDDLDLSVYQGEVFGNFQGLVQYNAMSSPVTVESVCKTMTSNSDPLLALADATALFYDSSLPKDERCIDANFKEMIEELTVTEFTGKDCGLACSSDRQWIWQSCNEFGYFQTTTGANHPWTAFKEVGIMAAGEKLCQETFGIANYSGPNTLWANTNYGNRKIGGVNITMPNGSIDPWHALSVVNKTDTFYQTCTAGICTPQAIGTGNDIVFIDGTAHCRDMYSPSALANYGFPDTPEITWAHGKISENVARYIS